MAEVRLDNDWTYIGLLVDSSGSMSNLNPINTANQLTNFVREQTNGKVTVCAAKFSDRCDVFIDNKPASEVTITADQIIPYGNTALYQSIGVFMDKIGTDLRNMTDVRPGKVIIVIMTDGEENASKNEYYGEAGRVLVQNKIKHQESVYNWIVYFLGTNIDAHKTGSNLGISNARTINFAYNRSGCTHVMKNVSNSVSRVRSALSREAENAASAFTNDERKFAMNVK